MVLCLFGVGGVEDDGEVVKFVLGVDEEVFVVVVFGKDELLMV